MESVEELTMTAVKIIILLIGVVFLFIIFTGMVEAAYEQIAFANVEKLSSAINEACFKNIHDINDAIAVDFELPQRVPSIPFIEELIEPFIGKFIIRPSGDPSYVLYYEMFPPGEGISWEVYHEFGYRAIGMLPEGATLSTASSFLEELRASAKGRLGEMLKDKPLDVFIGNIELTSEFDPKTGNPTEKGYGEFFGLGEWEDDNFIFDNYLALSVMNKTFLKYQPCGENSLCLKTTKGIYTYPLKYCTDIKYVQLVNRAERLQAKYSDFYLASPCKSTKVQVFLDDCRNDIFDFKWNFGLPSKKLKIWISPEQVGGCKKTTTYPIYRYNDDGFEFIGNHTTCLDMISDEGMSDPLPCVRVVFDGKKGFCYTQNLKRTWVDWLKSLPSIPDLGALITAGQPVTDWTKYIGNNEFILEPGKIPSTWGRIKPGEIWIWP